MSELAERPPASTRRASAPIRTLAPFQVCPYCARTFTRRGTALIEPCPSCQRPLHRAIGRQRRLRVVLLLATINIFQGIGTMIVVALFIVGAISIHRLCGWIALALFVAGTSYITDGALAWRTEISRAFGQIMPGHEARIAGAATMIFGIAAMLLSLAGITFLWAGPR